MILNIIILILIILKPTRCSIVNDVFNQEVPYVSQYCPKQKYCKEGTHVVCMYYDRNQVYGPRCENPVNVQLTPKMVQTILANVNDIRGKVATGTETGKNDEALPRAYGLMKLEWDQELAFLAQVLANQCLGGREDACRATDKFPNPSQSIAIIRYKYPNWEYLKPNNTEQGLNEGKVIFSIDRFLKSTHVLKKKVTKSIITSCPHLHELPDANIKYYLNLIRGGATHIGCGISAYSNYKMGETDSIQNSIQIVCNISDAPKPRQSVYKIVPPIPGQGYSKRCGCPRGYKESRSCLCEKDKPFAWTDNVDEPTKSTHNTIQIIKNMKKKKGVPQHKNQLENDLKRDKSSKHLQNPSHHDARNDEVKMATHSQSKLPVIHGIPKKKDRQTNGIKSPRTSKSHHINDFKGNNSKENYPQGEAVANDESSDEFSRITKAIAPNNNYIISKIPDDRKDLVIKFSSDPANATNIFDDLIFKVRNLNTYEEEQSTTERALDIVKENAAAKYRKPSQSHVLSKMKSVKLKNKYIDNKHKRLLSILSSLEQEVSNVKFDEDLKQLFYIKMRQIYETGVNKSQEAPSPSKLKKQQDKKELNDQRHYLENENNASVEDEVVALRRMIHRMSKGADADHEPTYAENDYNSNQNYNYMDSHFDEYHETKYVDNMGSFYEDIPSMTELAENQDYHDNILNSKINEDRQYDDSVDLRDISKNRNRESFAKNDARQTILSTAIDHHLDKYNDKRFELEQRALHKLINVRQRVDGLNKQTKIDGNNIYLDNNKNVKSSELRSFTGDRLQFRQPFGRRYQDDDMDRKRLRRPNLLDSLRFFRTER